MDRAKRRGRGRRAGVWMSKFGAWLLAMMVAISLLVGGVLYVIYLNPSKSVNLALEELLFGQQVVVGEVTFPRPGVVHVEGLRMKDPDGEGFWLELGEVEIDYDFEELKKHRHVKSLRLKRPVIHLDEAVVKGLSKTGLTIGKKSAAAKVNKALDLGFLATISDEIIVEDGRVVIEWAGLPKTSFAFDTDLKALLPGAGNAGSGGEWISAEPLSLKLRELKMELEEEIDPLEVEQIELAVMVSSDAKKVEIRRLQIIRPEVHITPSLLANFAKGKPVVSTKSAAGGAMAGQVQDNEANGEAAQTNGDAATALELVIGELVVRQGRFALSGFDGGDGQLLLPKVAFETSLNWSGIEIKGGQFKSQAELGLNLQKLSVDGAQGETAVNPLFAAKQLALRFLPQDLIQKRRLQGLKLSSPELHLSAENLYRVMGAGNEEKEKSEVDVVGRAGAVEQEKEDERISFELGELLIEGGRFFMEEMDEPLLPDVETSFTGQFSELKYAVAEGLVSSAEDQKVSLSDLRVNAAALANGKDLIKVAKVAVDFKIDDLLQQGRLHRLQVQAPKLWVNDETVKRWLPLFRSESVKEGGGSAPAEKMEKRGGLAKEEEGKIWQVGDLEITEGSFFTHLEKSIKGIPRLMGDFSLETLPFEFSADKDEMQEPHYRLHVAGLRVRPQSFVPSQAGDGSGGGQGRRGESSDRDVAFVRDLVVEVTPRELQQEKRIGSVVVAGGTLKLDEDFRALMGESGADGGGGGKKAASQGKENAAEVKAAPALSPVEGEVDEQVSGWSIGELGVNRMVVRLEAMVPQLEGVEFSVETTMRDVPLSADGLISRHHMQKVEIAGIELRDPYDGIRTAAVLPTIFLKFSLGGLMKQELESVDILGPVLFVGEPLFNWVEYQRKYRKQNEGNSLQPGEWQGEENQAGAGKNKQASEGGSWKLNHINAHYGKMVIAPIGTPIGIVPFPFAVETHLENGQIALNLEIPQEQYVYSLADLKLDMYGLSGKVEFNVPIKQENNNIWQNFKLDRLVWKQFNAEKISMEVTYDSKGIYGKLEGQAYEGYVNGAFNIYLKDIGKWDGWLAATDVNMGPITEALAPENFVMNGTISGKLVSSGKGLELGVTTGELRSISPGHIEISKLQSVLESLPKEWTQLKRSLSELALNGLKTFDYEKAEGKIDLLNRDGEIALDLRGPAGSRVFHFYLHDWRKKKGKEKDAKVVSVP
ncbi:MAG: hypothetical protein QM496_06270 [Verrucomicrobiota bacterium]